MRKLILMTVISVLLTGCLGEKITNAQRKEFQAAAESYAKDLKLHDSVVICNHFNTYAMWAECDVSWKNKVQGRTIKRLMCYRYEDSNEYTCRFDK